MAQSLLAFAGGRISRPIIGVLILLACVTLYGATPMGLLAAYLNSPPEWLLSPRTHFAALFLAPVMIYWTLRFNLWSRQQDAINELAEDLSWAINNLLNRRPPATASKDIDAWQEDFGKWCKRVSEKLENKAFFTKADRLHFDSLGFLEPVVMSGNDKFNWLLSQLKLKFERLRDIVNWAQQRRR